MNSLTAGRLITGRREHSLELKRELVARSLLPGASVSAIALDAGINANLLFAWRLAQHNSSGQIPGPSAPVLLRVSIGASQEVDVVVPTRRRRRVTPQPARSTSTSEALVGAFVVSSMTRPSAASAVAARRRMIGARSRNGLRRSIQPRGDPDGRVKLLHGLPKKSKFWRVDVRRIAALHPACSCSSCCWTSMAIRGRGSHLHSLAVCRNDFRPS